MISTWLQVEYNECARNYIAQADMPTDQKEAILNRLIKVVIRPNITHHFFNPIINSYL